MILNFHEYKQVWCYQTDFRPVRKELEGEKKKSGKEMKWNEMKMKWNEMKFISSYSTNYK